MKEKFIEFYMDVARRAASMSYAKKLKVGAVLAKNDNIISWSYNGSPAGWDNNCEEKVWMPHDANQTFTISQIAETWPYEAYSDYSNSDGIFPVIGRYYLKTKPEVAHAEENLIMKLSRSHESAEGSTLFVTHNPCFVCSRLIYGSGIKKVYYESDYRDSSGIQFLLDCGVEIEKYDRK